MQRIKKYIPVSFVISCIVAWTLLACMGLSWTISDDNLIYAIGQKHAYNSSLFNGNVYMGEGVISPRYIIDALFSGMMHLNGGNWAGAALAYIYFGVVVQSIAIANIAKRINEQYQIVITAIFTCLILFCDNYLAGFSLVAVASTSIGAALAFSFLSISFLVGEDRNYNAAWCFAACAVVCHIHEGIYCCAVVGMLALVDCIFQKRVMIKENRTILVAVAALLMVTAPSFLTDSMNISNEEFVYIYSKFRHPHHLQPSAWGINSVFTTFWVDAALLLVCFFVSVLTKKENAKKKLAEVGILLFAWAAAFVIMFFFTEIFPLAVISTMFLSKSFKYVLLVALIWIVKAFSDLRTEGKVISSYLVLLFAFTASSFELKWIPLLFVALIFAIHNEDKLKKNQIPLILQWIMDITVTLLFVCIKLGSNLIALVAVPLVFLAVGAIEFSFKEKFKGYKALCLAACICMMGLSLVQRVVFYSNGSISLLTGEQALKNSMTDDLYELAENFKDATDEQAEFLGNPDNESRTGWFQIVSERNCYVIQKVIPSSKCTVKEWYDRYMETIGYDDKSASDLKEIMSEAGVEYALISSENYNKFDKSDNFEVFTTSSEDTYRIYKLID